MTFNTRLKNIRKRSKKTQKSVSDHLGVTLRTYQRYEEGTIEPPLSNIVSIAKYFDLPVDCLLGNGLFANWEEILLHKDEILHILGKEFPIFPSGYDLSGLTESMLANILPAIFAKITFEGSRIDAYPRLPLGSVLPPSADLADGH